MPKAVTQDKIDEVRAMRAQGIPVSEIEKLTGVSHNSISKYTKDMKNPAAAATTAGTEDDENITYEKLSDDIIASSYGNVKPLEEATETPTESEDKPDVKTYGDSPETPTDERTEGTAAKDVPFSVFVACLTRISDLTTRLHDCEKMSESIRREIAELEAFIK